MVNADRLLALLNCVTESAWCETFFALSKAEQVKIVVA